MNRKYEWEPIERAYVDAEQRTTLKIISERFNIPYQTIRRYAATHGWEGKRLLRRSIAEGEIQAANLMRRSLMMKGLL